jgi:hypothetical protein
MKLQIILIPKLFISLLINYKYKQTNPHYQPGGRFFPKNFLWFFLTNTLFKGLSPLFDCQYVIYGGGIRGREGVAPGIGGNVGRSYQKLLIPPLRYDVNKLL